MSARLADAAAQSDPNRNVHFRRWWGDAGATGPAPGEMRSWHARDLPEPPMSQARRQAEIEWLCLTRSVS